MSQSFSFGVNFCLSQSQGGPCGVLAPIQALIIKSLVFGKSKNYEKLPEPEISQIFDSLLNALCYTLSRVSESEICAVIIQPTDSTIPIVKIAKIENLNSYKSLISERFSDFIDSHYSVLQFVISIIMTKSIQSVKDDMDDHTTPLIGRFGHCSQELVNLMLTGRATSNVFDGVQDLGDGLILRGVENETPLPVGYLSELETLRYVTVGNILKFPSLPLWIVGSPTHYTVLFGLKATDAAVSAERAVDLEIRKAFNSNAFDEGIARSEDLHKIIHALKIPNDALPRATKFLVQEGVVLLSDFEDWAMKEMGFSKRDAKPHSDLNLWLINGQEPVTVTPVIVSFNSLEGDDDSFAATLQTRWPEASVKVIKD